VTARRDLGARVDKEPDVSWLNAGTGIAVGVAVGTALGVALGKIALGVALGAGLGAGIGVVSHVRRKGREDTPAG
jgi:hypothetical protein